MSAQSLIDQILAQLECRVSSIFFNKAHVTEWLEQGYGLESDVSRNTAERLERTLQNYTIEISELTFPEAGETDEIPAHVNILRKLKRVHFKNCRFECSQLALPGVRLWFENCTFSADWLVTCSGYDDLYIARGDTLFEHCSFAGTASLTDISAEDDALCQYDCLFFDCFAKALTVYRIGLKSQLWAVESLPREDQPRLQELTLLSVDARSPINLSHQVIERVQITDSHIADLNFYGGKAGTLTLMNTECNGSCSLELSEIGNLLFSDSTFNRPVNLSRMKAGNLDIKRVDFEKVLACNEVTITSGITLRSVRHAVAPDFVDMKLTAEAKANSDRETFRLIKHSFEAVANRIEANRFFGLEMEAYRKELKQSRRFCSPERLLVEANHITSRHGQSYARPFFWLVLASLVNVALMKSAMWELPEFLTSSAVYQCLVGAGNALNTFAQGFSVFSVLMREGMEFASLALALLMSTFVWHFLVAVRRFTRG